VRGLGRHGAAELLDQPERAQLSCSVTIGSIVRARLSWAFGPFR
jgi:hypothetical protein